MGGGRGGGRGGGGNASTFTTTTTIQSPALDPQAKHERSLHLAVPYLGAGLLLASLPRLAAASPPLALAAVSVAVACVQVRRAGGRACGVRASVHID